MNSPRVNYDKSGEINLQWCPAVLRDVPWRVWFLLLLRCPNRSRHLRKRIALLLSYRWRESCVFAILHKYYTLIYKIRLHLLHLRLDYDAVLSSLATLPMPKGQVRMSFVTKGKAATATVAKSIYNDIELSKETFQEEYRYPRSESPPSESRCYLLLFIIL